MGTGKQLNSCRQTFRLINYVIEILVFTALIILTLCGGNMCAMDQAKINIERSFLH